MASQLPTGNTPRAEADGSGMVSLVLTPQRKVPAGAGGCDSLGDSLPPSSLAGWGADLGQEMCPRKACGLQGRRERWGSVLATAPLAEVHASPLRPSSALQRLCSLLFFLSTSKGPCAGGPRRNRVELPSEWEETALLRPSPALPRPGFILISNGKFHLNQSPAEPPPCPARLRWSIGVDSSLSSRRRESQTRRGRQECALQAAHIIN